MEHAVIVHLKLTDEDLGTSEAGGELESLEAQLAAAVEDTEAGEFDGDEFGEGECVFYMYGPDADRLFATIEPILKSSPLAAGRFAIKRYGEAGDPDAREIRVRW
jgi:hypothetical protein